MHIVAFDVPFPPNYGGVIDVFYKLKKLSELGVKIHLHCFEYGRGRQDELLKYCYKVSYYKRNISFKKVISKIPYIVKSRENETLTQNLLKDNFPILFEGLHTTASLLNTDFGSRKVLIRTHNIEHYYYKGLYRSENKKRKKLFFKTEAKKLEKYENILKKADYILSISPYEHEYFKKKYSTKTIYTPVFYDRENNQLSESDTKFALWHGDLRVVDNVRAALEIIQIFSSLKHKLIIASNCRNKEVIESVAAYKNISFDSLETEGTLEKLISSAHVHPMITYQKTGIKLKLLHILSKGRFVVANSLMVEDTGLEHLCSIANTKKEFTNSIEKLMNSDYSKCKQEERMQTLEKFDTHITANKIVELLK